MMLGTEDQETLGNRSGKELGAEEEGALGNRLFGILRRLSGMPGNRDPGETEAGLRQHRVTGVAGGSTNFRRRRETGDARKSENEFRRTPGRPGVRTSNGKP